MKQFQQEDLPRITLPPRPFTKISFDEVERMEKIPDADEIKHVVWCCDPSKDPAYDGYNFKFIKEMWEVTGDEIISFVTDFFTTCQFHPQ